MDKRVQRSFQLNFDRNKDTYNLLKALIGFKELGKTSWGYELGESDARDVEYWCHLNKNNYFEKFSPDFDEKLTSIDDCLEIVVHYLILIYAIVKRKELPEDDIQAYDDLLNFNIEINDVFDSSSKRYLNQNLNELFGDIYKTSKTLKIFRQVIRQLYVVSQDNFFNPSSIFKSIKLNKYNLDIKQ